MGLGDFAMTFGMTVIAATVLGKAPQGTLNTEALLKNSSPIYAVRLLTGQDSPPAPGQRRQRGGGTTTPPANQQDQDKKPDDKGEQTDKQEDPFAKATKDYEKQEGMFNTYVKENSILFEIPKAMLGRDFMWYIESKATPNGGYSGSDLDEGMIRFEKRGDSILVRMPETSVKATGGDAMKLGVKMSNEEPIIQALDIKATSKSGGMLVDVSRMFVQGIPEFRGSPGAGNVDTSRTFVDKVLTFPENVNVQVTKTLVGAPGGGGGGGRGFGAVRSRPSTTGTVYNSIVLLPEKPMMGRLADSRVGYFSTPFTLYDGKAQGTKDEAFIDRYRLEKKDPNAAISDPVKPIVYYIGREVPEEWHKYIKEGIEDWQSAFEQAGFSNAIICKDAPTEKEDPKWSPEDLRYSVIRWAPLPIANAMGPHVSDPRSGEILSAHVIVWHDVMKLAAEWYFAQASACDPNAQKLPLPKELMGELLRFVVSHEVGHTLGLPHNGKASAMVPTELLRSKQWTDENGTAPSIMDYARFNYVAQPGDNARLIPKIGVYDKFSIKWGYSPIVGAAKPEDEESTLDAWAAQQVQNPMLRFYDNFSSSDPTAQSEALGDDAVVASTYGVKNLKRSMGYLMTGATKYGEDYSMLEEFHGALYGQFSRYIGHVMVMVGGVVQTDYHAGRGGNVYAPVPHDKQKAAVKWLTDNVFVAPTWLIPQNIIAKLTNNSGMGYITGAQSRVVNGLLSNSRLGRMMDNQLMYGAKAYTVAEMFGDVRKALWTELSAPSPVIDPYRRSLQRTYVNALIGKLSDPSSEPRAYASNELRMQAATIASALPMVKDGVTKAHLRDLAMMIDQALKFPPPVSQSAGIDLSSLFGIRTDERFDDPCGMWSTDPLGDIGKN